GSRNAILDGQGWGYVFHLQASYWTLQGFTVTNGQKGIMLDGANANLLDSLYVHSTDDEGVHFRAFSSNNTIQNSTVADTGASSPGFGEGIYLGTANSNWSSVTGGQPDTSDHNHVLNNHLGPNIRAEAIDIKEGTTGGEIRGNTFDGIGMSGQNFADSWMDVKG